MSACKDKKNNKENESTLDRYYHDSESFLWRHKWWVVAVLAILVIVYFYKNHDSTSTGASSGMTTGATGATGTQGVIRPNELNVGAPATLDTDERTFLRL